MRHGDCLTKVVWIERRYNTKECTPYPEACTGLNDLITAEEVAAVLGKLEDVGAGPDGMPPVVLRDHANHVSCPVIQSMVRDFNVVFGWCLKRG